MTEPFRIEFVAGVTPDKWLRVWARRKPDEPIEAVAVVDDPTLTSLREGTASMSLVRLPVDRDGMHLIPLYHEVPVVVVAKEHPVSAYDEVDVSELADEVLLQRPESVPEWLAIASPDALERARTMPEMSMKEAISVVATGSGIVIVPLSLARVHHRKDVVHRPVAGVAESAVGLAWRVDDTDARIEDFIGIVRGRTERSSRGAGAGGRTEPTERHTGRHTGRKGADATGTRRGRRAQGTQRRRGR